MTFYLKDIRKMSDEAVMQHIDELKSKLATFGGFNPTATTRALNNLSKFDLVAKERNLVTN